MPILPLNGFMLSVAVYWRKRRIPYVCGRKSMKKRKQKPINIIPQKNAQFYRKIVCFDRLFFSSAVQTIFFIDEQSIKWKS